MAKRRNIPSETASLFKVLSDETRMRIIMALRGTEISVSSLASGLGMSISAASHQLGILRASRLVRKRRRGRRIFYSLDDSHVEGLIDLARDHVRHG